MASLVDPGPGLRELIQMYRTGLIPDDLEQPSRVSQSLGMLSGLVLEPILALATMRIVVGGSVGSVPKAPAAAFYGLRRIASTWWLFIALALTFVALAIPTLIVAAGLGAQWSPLWGVGVVPFVYVGVRLAPVLGAFVVDDARGFAAIGRSWTLSRRRWWATAGALAISAALAIALALATVVLQVLIPGSGDASAFARAAVGALVGAFTGPIPYAVVAVLYLDLRARHEPTPPSAVRTMIERHDPD
ncbi:MAG TPA: hypothetical protein VLA82_00515 [Actinomycetota bacterium]|nr:hypothetical protein [Actinomycetota bacterium]